MIDISWLVVIVPAAFAVGGIAGIGALALYMARRGGEQ